MLQKLRDILAKFARRGVADKDAVEELGGEIQRVLIQADVEVRLAKEIAERIRKKALQEELPKGLTRREHVINIVYNELIEALGKTKPQLKLGKQKILLLGLFGSGKTTMTVKLARFYQQRGLSVGVIGCDVWRPAALEQLRTLAKQAAAAGAGGIEVYGEEKEKDPIAILRRGLQKLKAKDVLIVDSAGRSALDEELRREIVAINNELKPDERLLIVSADIGQAAGKQASEFKKTVGVTGVIVTKMDSSAKGGGALSTCAAAGVPVKLIGIGEKIDDLELYDPTRFVGRILGMGDLQALLEKAKAAMAPEKAAEMLTGEFTLEDFYQQIEAMGKMGPLSKVMEMIPGMAGLGAKLPKEALGTQEEKMKRWRHIINSMTKEERRKPEVLDRSRIERIAKGSGTKPEEVKELMKSYETVKKMMKKLSGAALGKMKGLGGLGGLGKMFKGFGGMPGF